MKKIKNNYIDKEQFYLDLVQYKKIYTKAKHEYIQRHEDKIEFNHRGKIKKNLDLPEFVPPRIPESIGKAMFLIAKNLANSPNFRNYSYVEEMISDAYYTCILRIDSFDPTISTNAFSYFTQLCWFAYVQRLKTEKKQTEIKHELIRNSTMLDSLLAETQEMDTDTYDSSYVTFLQDTVNVIRTDAERSTDGVKQIKKTTKKHQSKVKLLKEQEELEEKRAKWKENHEAGISDVDLELDTEETQYINSLAKKIHDEHE